MQALATTQRPALRADETLRGILLMLGAMAVFSAMDATSKFLTADYNPLMVAWGRYLMQSVLLLPLILWAGAKRALRSIAPAQQTWRGVCLYASSICFIGGLSQLPLAEASALGFVSPMFTTALSIPFLGEKVGIRRWLAIAVGFAGVLIVIRPGTAAFNAAALLPILSASFWAVALIITRRMSHRGDPPLTTLVYASYVGVMIGLPTLPWAFTMPNAEGWLIITAMGAMSIAGHYLLVHAFQRGTASILAPFSYSQMVWAVILGYVVFGALPDLWTWIGAAVIILSGVYVWHRERVRRGLAGA
ncbi:MAG: DMT family transporter [Alphaproteobacteria bacterium]|nr:DMT family transporter [Alphaproteobacteria bacterium]